MKWLNKALISNPTFDGNGNIIGGMVDEYPLTIHTLKSLDRNIVLGEGVIPWALWPLVVDVTETVKPINDVVSLGSPEWQGGSLVQQWNSRAFTPEEADRIAKSEMIAQIRGEITQDIDIVKNNPVLKAVIDSRPVDIQNYINNHFGSYTQAQKNALVASLVGTSILLREMVNK